MRINNELPMFRPDVSETTLNLIFVPAIIGSILAVVIGLVGMVDVSLYFLLCLLFPLVIPMVHAFFDGHALHRLGWGSSRVSSQNSRVLLYETHRALPKEVRYQVGSLSVKDIMELSGEDAGRLNISLRNLVDSYNKVQRELKKPRVTVLMHAIEDAKTGYDEQTKALRKAVDSRLDF